MQPLLAILIETCLLAQQAADERALSPQPLLLRLDGATRAKVLAALAALIMLGFLLIALAWLGARMTRRYMGSKKKPGPTALPSDEEWSRAAKLKQKSENEAGPRDTGM